MEVWLESAHSKEKVQLTDLREFVIKDRHQDLQAVLCDILSGELGPDNPRKRGGAGTYKVLSCCMCDQGSWALWYNRYPMKAKKQ